MVASEENERTDAVVERLAKRLRARGETVSFAESCTGGLTSAMMTAVAGVSDVYLGSIVAYSYPVKISELGVLPGTLSTMGAVSLPVARQMAVGAQNRLGSTWTVSITGIAGPGGGTVEKPVGTVCFGICGPGVEKVEQRWFEGDRRRVQEASAFFALSLLISELGDSHD